MRAGAAGAIFFETTCLTLIFRGLEAVQNDLTSAWTRARNSHSFTKTRKAGGDLRKMGGDFSETGGEKRVAIF